MIEPPAISVFGGKSLRTIIPHITCSWLGFSPSDTSFQFSGQSVVRIDGHTSAAYNAITLRGGLLTYCKTIPPSFKEKELFLHDFSKGLALAATEADIVSMQLQGCHVFIDTY